MDSFEGKAVEDTSLAYSPFPPLWEVIFANINCGGESLRWIPYEMELGESKRVTEFTAQSWPSTMAETHERHTLTNILLPILKPGLCGIAQEILRFYV